MAQSGDWRMTVETLAAGQPRAYADSVYRHRVRFERVPTLGANRTEYEPAKWEESVVLPKLRAVQVWYDKPDWHQPRLDYARKTEEGVWEFQVTQPFLD